MSAFPRSQSSPLSNHRPNSSAVRLSRPGEIALQVSYKFLIILIIFQRLGEKFALLENGTSGWLIHGYEIRTLTARKKPTTNQAIMLTATAPLMNFQKTSKKEVRKKIKQVSFLFNFFFF